MRYLVPLLLATTLARADDATDKLIDQLFHADETKRAAARKTLLARKEDVLARVLDRIEKRQKRAERVMQVYAVKDLAQDKVVWALARERLDDLDAVIRQQDSGVLVVLANRAVHARIAATLDEIRERLTHVVTISSAIVQLGEGVAVPTGFKPGTFDAWVRANPVVVKPLPRLTCRNGQRVEVTAMRQVAYVSDFEVEVAQGTLIADPVVDTLPSGISLHVRAIAGKKIALHVDLRSAELAQPLKAAELPLPAGEPVQIQIPEARSVHIRTARKVASGAFTVVDLGDGRVVVIGAKTHKLAK